MNAATSANIRDVKRTLEVLFEPGDVFEVRVLKTKQRTRSGYFTRNEAALKAIAAEDESRVRVPAVYVTLNPVNDDLIARSKNRMKGFAETLTSDKDVKCRRNLLIDADPVRSAGISSTAAEHQEALQRTREIGRWLKTEYGVRPVLVGDSGNGWHLILAIDLPNDEASRALCERVLKSLDFLFSDERVKVDTSVANAARIVKCYGTMARKGDNTKERPHRRSSILYAHERVAVSPDVLAQIAARLPAVNDRVTQTAIAGERFDVDAFLALHEIGVRRSGTWNCGMRWILTECVFDSTHTGSSAAIIQLPNGALSYKCQHDSCVARVWSDLREKFEPGYKTRHRESASPQVVRQPQLEPPSQRKARMKLVALRDVKIERTEWLEIGYIPARNFTLFEGRGGIGKTTMALGFLAARSRGRRLFPVDQKIAAHYPLTDPQNVLIIAKEDDHATLRARLCEAGACESRITLIDGLDYINEGGEVEEHDSVVYFPRDLGALAEAIDATDAGIVYIDALHSHVVTENPKDPVAVRQAYQKLIDLCRDKNVTIIAVRHPGKGVGHAHDRGLGSSEILHMVRSVLLFDQHPKDDTLRVVAPVKGNLWEEMPTVTYRIEKVEAADDDGRFFAVSKIEIIGTDDTIKANDLAMAMPDDSKARTQVEECVGTILGLFDHADTIRASEITANCSDFSERTVERARSSLTGKGALKRGRAGGVGEEGAYITYAIDRAKAALFAKNSRCSPPSRDGGQWQELADNGSIDFDSEGAA